MNEAEQFRAELTPKVAEAIWTALEQQVHMGYIDRDGPIIDVGYADSINIHKLADAAIDTILAAFDPPFAPTKRGETQ